LSARPNANRDGELRLIAFNATTHVWMSQEQVHKLAERVPGKPETKFMDITDFQDLGDPNPNMILRDIPDKPAFEAVVRPLLELLDDQQIPRMISLLSAFPTRFYTSASGEEAVEFLVTEFQRHSAHRPDVVVAKFANTFRQPSIIARMEGEGPNADEVVIIGAHVDSTSNGATAPGADDDASGTAIVLEVFRVLSTSNFKPKRTIEFHG